MKRLPNCWQKSTNWRLKWAMSNPSLPLSKKKNKNKRLKLLHLQKKKKLLHLQMEKLQHR